MHHSLTLDDLPRDGEKLDLAKISKLNGILLLVGGIGAIISLIYLLGFADTKDEAGHVVVNRQGEFAYSWLFAFFYFFTLCAGALFWTILHHATDSEWSVLAPPYP